MLILITLDGNRAEKIVVSRLDHGDFGHRHALLRSDNRGKQNKPLNPLVSGVI